MLHARQLIQQGRYAEARTILQSIDHPKAKEWLGQLDERELNVPLPQAAPPPQQIVYQVVATPEKKRRSRGCGCLNAVASLILLAVLIAVVIALTTNNEDGEPAGPVDKISGTQRALVTPTVQVGTLRNPYPAGTQVQFARGTILIDRMVRPATVMVEDFNQFNEDPAVGAEYVLLWVNLTCGEDRCQPQLDFKIRLVDTNGKEWGEPMLIILEPNLDGQEALRGAALAGWQAFEYPIGEPIQAIWMRWGNQTFYVQPPA